MMNKSIRCIMRTPMFIKIFCVFLLLFVVRMHYVSCAPDSAAQLLFDFTQDSGLIREALNNGAAVDTRRKDDDMTPLMAAVQSGNVERARLFMEYGADINAISSKLYGRSVLYFAVSNVDNAPNMNMLALLLANGANVRDTDNLGNTVLHGVLRVNYFENIMPIVALLIKHGASLNAQNKNGDTMLHSAVENNNIRWIDAMRDTFGALVDTTVRNKKGLTPIEYAKDLNFMDIVIALQKPFPVFGIKGNVDLYDVNGLTPLMLTVIGNRKDLVTTLVKDRLAHIDLRTNDTFGYSILHLALFQQELDMISLLISLGAKPEQKDNAGRTALLGIPWMQSLQKRKKALDILIKAGSNINERDNQGNGLLHYLILHNDLPLFKYVLQMYGKTIQPNLSNNDLQSPIDLARRLRRWEFVKALGGSQ